MGFTTGVSRIATSKATFFFPMMMANYGFASTLYITGVLLFIGCLVSLFMAPETKNMSLSEASYMNRVSNTKQSKLVTNKNIN